MQKDPGKETSILPPLLDEYESGIFPSEEFKEQAYFSSYKQYKKIYNFSVEDPEKFWSNTAKELHWFNPWKRVKQGKGFNSKWFAGAKTNISFNCLDVHLKSNKRNKAAIIWESEDGSTQVYTYQFLYSNVCSIANALKDLGIKKSDNIAIYMGTMPETVIAMLACMRIGAIPSVIHTGFNVSSLSERINSLNCKLIFTQDFILRKGTFTSLKDKIDAAIDGNDSISNVIVFRRVPGKESELHSDKEIYWNDIITSSSNECEAEPLDSQHPAFSLFTNDPWGRPVKIFHVTGGYMVQAYISSKWVYDLKDEDMIWTTPDLSWVSSLTYSLFGPLLNGVTTFLYEGNPVYPKPDRFWQIISKYRINILNTIPTLLRAFKKLGDEWILSRDLSSLRLLGTISEPVHPDTWYWYYNIIGQKKIPVVNTWMQTETGSVIVSPIPGASEMMPGLTCNPFPGTQIDIVDLKGNAVGENEGGYLIIKDSWPSMFTTETDSMEDIKLNCWDQVKGSYFTGDAAIRKKNGFIKILGRVDDIIISAGNRVGGSEIENILMEHSSVEEAAVVKRPDEVLGNAIIAFVSTVEGIEQNLLLREELRNYVLDKIGSLSKPDELIFINKLPRLEDGKINRRLLRKMSLEGTPELKGTDEEDFFILERLREDYQKIYLR